jgi:hypothetical protein
MISCKLINDYSNLQLDVNRNDSYIRTNKFTKSLLKSVFLFNEKG